MDAPNAVEMLSGPRHRDSATFGVASPWRRAKLKEISEPFPDRHAYAVEAVREMFVAGIVESSLSDSVKHKLTCPAQQITLLEIMESVEGRFDHAMPASLKGLSADAAQRVESAMARGVNAIRKQLAVVTR